MVILRCRLQTGLEAVCVGCAFSYDPAVCPDPTLVVIARPLPELAETLTRDGVRLVQAHVIRNSPASVDPSIKSNNLLNNVLAMQEAVREGAFEAILLNHRGELAECSQSNLFVVRDGEVLTPPRDAGLLRGVTREFLFEVGADLGVMVREAVLRPTDLDTVDELFVTSTNREIVPAVAVDDHTKCNIHRPAPLRHPRVGVVAHIGVVE